MDPPTNTPDPDGIGSLIIWAGLGFLAMMPDLIAGPQSYASTTYLGFLSIFFGIWAFWTHGDTRITGAGLYSLAMSFYVGFASLWWSAQDAEAGAVHVATLTGYWTTLLMWGLFWRTSYPQNPRQLSPHIPASTTAWSIRLGILGTAAGALAGYLDYGNTAQFALGGLLLLIVGLVLHRAPKQQLVFRLLLSSLVVYAFFEYASDGRGRLNLVSLALAAIVLASTKVHTKHFKAVIILSTAPALWLLVRVRAQLGVQETGSEYDGLGSVVNPLRDFGRLVTASRLDQISLAGFEPFIATLFFWIPRSVWPSKPDGFGRQLVATLEPGLLQSNHSMAAHAYGEWFFAFGWVGVLTMILVLGLMVRTLDSAFTRFNNVSSRRDMLIMCGLIALVAGTPTLAWVGTFTYFSRVGQQLLLLLTIALPSATRTKQSDPKARNESLSQTSLFSHADNE